jgi:hypothetical protein
MGVGTKKYTVSDSTGSTVAITRSNKVEIIVRSAGPDRVFMAWNEDAVDDIGIFLDSGDIMVLNRYKSDADVYFVTAAGGTAVIYFQITN